MGITTTLGWVVRVRTILRDVNDGHAGVSTAGDTICDYVPTASMGTVVSYMATIVSLICFVIMQGGSIKSVAVVNPVW